MSNDARREGTNRRGSKESIPGEDDRVKLVRSDGVIVIKGVDDCGVPRSNTDPCGGEEVVDPCGGRSAKLGETEEDACFHMITIDVFIALAFPTPSQENARVLEQLIQKGKKTLDAPKPTYYFHCEYTLLPGSDPTITDVVTYPVAAKVFTDSETKVVRTWNDGNLIWVTWNQNHEVMITQEMAYKLHGHKVEVKISNGKEKVSSKAKNDKPKAFRIPGSSDSDSVKDAVRKISSTWLLSQPRSSTSQLSVDLSEIDDDEDRNISPIQARSSLGRLAGIKTKDKMKECEFTKNDRKRVIDLEKESDKIKKQLKKVHSLAEKFTIGTTNAMASGDDEEKFGQIDYFLRLEKLFAGEKNVVSRLHDGFGPMCDSYIHINLDRKLLPRGLEKKLNPMVLTVKTVKNLPNTPIPYERLDEECEEVYCKYKFMNCDEVITPSAPHGKDAHFNDVRVIFLGALNQAELAQYIQENSFKIYIHDRDQKAKSIDEEHPPVLFGGELNDTKGGKGGAKGKGDKKWGKKNDAGGMKKLKAEDIFDDLPDLNYFAYHGVAQISLVDLLYGETNLYYEAAVLPSEAPEYTGKLMRAIRKEKEELTGKEAKKLAVMSKMFPPHPDYPVVLPVFEEDAQHNLKVAALKQRVASLPLPPGNYVANDTSLKIHVKLTQPLITHHPCTWVRRSKKTMGHFWRVVFCFSYSNKGFLKKLDEFITTSNAQALGLSHFEYHVMESALSTYKLSKEEKKSTKLDMITGFHVIDGEYHIFVLEGLLIRGALKRLLAEVPRTKTEDDEIMMELYDSHISFTERKYADLDVNLSRVRLYQPLSTIIQQPLIYIRDIIPKLCLDAILNLHKITQAVRLRDLVSSQLFPSSEMILSLNRELGVAITFKDFEEHHKTNESEEADQNIEGQEPVVRRPILKKRKTLSQTNEYYEEILKFRRQSQRRKSIKDYITQNVHEVRRKSIQNEEKRIKSEGNCVAYIRANCVGFNYSTQKRNSTQASKQVLQKFLKSVDPKARFTYSEDFQWATVEPAPEEEKTETKKLKKKGFVCTTMKKPHVDVDEARKDDLKYAFRDNILHANHLQSPLQWRTTNEWNDDTQMKKYLKPNEYFTSPLYRSIFSPKNPTVQRNHDRKEKEEWMEKVVVGDTRMHFHRVLPRTEKGNCSNQCDRLKSLLKDEPKKLSLKKFPTPNLPPIYMLNEGYDTGMCDEISQVDKFGRTPKINSGAMTSQPKNRSSTTKSSKPSTSSWSYETDFRFFRPRNVIRPVSASQQIFSEQQQQLHHSLVEQEI